MIWAFQMQMVSREAKMGKITSEMAAEATWARQVVLTGYIGHAVFF